MFTDQVQVIFIVIDGEIPQDAAVVLLLLLFLLAPGRVTLFFPLQHLVSCLPSTLLLLLPCACFVSAYHVMRTT